MIIFPPCNFLIITFELASLKRPESRVRLSQHYYVLYHCNCCYYRQKKMLWMWRFKGAFPRFHGHSINYLHKLCIFHLEVSSSDSFSSPPLHQPESNRGRMCPTINRGVWAVYHRLTSRCWHRCCIHTWQSHLPVCLKVPCWSDSSALPHILALPQLLTLHLYVI